MCFYYVCTQYLQNKQHGLGDQLSLYQITLGINVPTSKIAINSTFTEFYQHFYEGRHVKITTIKYLKFGYHLFVQIIH